MSYTLSKNTNSYKEAIGVVESLETPALGFIRPGDYSNTIANGTAIIKQNNLQLQLLTQIAEGIQEIRDDLKSVLDYQRRKGGTSILPDDLITKLSNLSLGPRERPKEPKGRLLVFKDPLKILRQEKEKLENGNQNSRTIRGYETWQNGEANFLVTRGLIGRLSNTPNVAFAYEVNGVVDYLTSHGVIALPGWRYTTRQLQGLNWVVRPTNTSIPLQPREVSSNNLIDGRLSISFSNYQATPSTHEAIYNRNDDEAPSDEEELRLHTIAVLIEERGLLVKRLHPLAALPRRATTRATGYDLPINRA
ncbi:hypothetical protein ZIOFF_070143 [Zingiber officinale]|uniref:Uncharacterized protein n=1 Tax=Zingiber officinale TaxID=94328 RepID=A0A8J5C718_ZINOF|nr:hypothetical protein ZIOFF_070143 [Zingiber officinale]